MSFAPETYQVSHNSRCTFFNLYVVASELAVDARNAALTEKDARLDRLRRLLRRKHGKVPRQL